MSFLKINKNNNNNNNNNNSDNERVDIILFGNR